MTGYATSQRGAGWLRLCDPRVALKQIHVALIELSSTLMYYANRKATGWLSGSGCRVQRACFFLAASTFWSAVTCYRFSFWLFHFSLSPSAFAPPAFLPSPLLQPSTFNLQPSTFNLPALSFCAFLCFFVAASYSNRNTTSSSPRKST